MTDTNTGDKIKLIQIDCGSNYTIGITKNGKVVSWGSNDCGQLGRGDKKQRFSWGKKHRSVPTKVKALDGRVIIKISCGKDHTAAITDKGELYIWYVQS